MPNWPIFRPNLSSLIKVVNTLQELILRKWEEKCKKQKLAIWAWNCSWSQRSHHISNAELAPNCVGLARNETNLRLFKFSFSTFWPKRTETDHKSPTIVHLSLLGPITLFGANPDITSCMQLGNNYVWRHKEKIMFNVSRQRSCLMLPTEDHV